MPQGYYTLEEAARILLMSVDELKLMARRGQIRFFQDRGTLRFRVQDIQELARQRGLGSDPELPLGETPKPRPSDSPAPKQPSSGAAAAGSLVEIGGSSLPPTPQPGSDSDVRLVEDADFTLQVGSQVKLTSPTPGPRTPPPSSRSGPVSPPPRSKVMPPASSAGSVPPSSVSKSPAGEAEVLLVPPDSDSDVRLVPPQEQAKVPLGEGRSLGATDSDIRLEPLVPLTPSPEEGMLTEEIDLDEELRRQAAAAAPAPSPQTGATPPVAPPKRPETSPTSPAQGPSPSQVGKSATQAPATPAAGTPTPSAPTTEDSSSDFDLTPAGQSSSPLELSSGEIPLVGGEDQVKLGDSPAAAVPASGINLDRPVDSGISLDKTEPGSDEIEYELTLDEPSSPTEQLPHSSSEFELTLESSEKPSANAASDSEFELTLALDQPASAEAGSDPSSSEFELTLEPTGSSPLAADSGAAPASASSSDSDSEFELNVDESLGSSGVLELGEEGADIFEEPVADAGESGSLALPLEEGSDLESSEFEVVDEAVEGGEESTSQAVPIDEVLEEGVGEEVVVAPEEEEERVAPPEQVLVTAAPWGPLPTIFLLPSVVVLFLVGLMGFELLQGLNGYHSPGLVTKAITDLIMPK